MRSIIDVQHISTVEKYCVCFYLQPPFALWDFNYFQPSFSHDWPDKVAVKILRNVRAAMKPCSRILIRMFSLPIIHITEKPNKHL